MSHDLPIALQLPGSPSLSWWDVSRTTRIGADDMDLQMRGKRALVTGSTAGIGLAAAVGLYKEGASVVVNGRTKERVEEAVGKIRGTGGDGEVSGIAADLSTAEGVTQLLGQLPEVDILVNNLGIFEPKPFEEIPDEDWLRFFETKVMSGVRLTRHYLPGMRRNNWGRIVFISSESGLQIPVEMIHYGMTKTAQIAIARGVAESGITVTQAIPMLTHKLGDPRWRGPQGALLQFRVFVRAPAPFGSSCTRKNSPSDGPSTPRS